MNGSVDFRFMTLNDLDEITKGAVKEVWQEGRWIVALLDNGVRFKFKNWSPSDARPVESTK